MNRKDRGVEDMGLEEAALDALFAQARAETPPPSIALLSAILADAGEIDAARRAEAEAFRPVAARKNRWFAAILEPLGGWRGLTVLGTCAVLGLWVGMTDLTGYYGLASPTTVAASDDGSADQVDAFYNLASVEG